MLHIPILRHGVAYESIDQVELVHHATGTPIATVSQANSGMVARDISRMADDVLERFSVNDLIAKSKKAAELFMTASLPIGDTSQTFDDYIGLLSATTGMPITYCRNNADKIRRVLSDIDKVIHGLTRGFDLSILDQGYGSHNGGTLSYFREGRIFGAVLPSNSPGVHSLWVPAIALKAPIALKPGREEPWTPYRIIQAFCEAGVPREAFGFYPTSHAGAAELLRHVDRSMLFGDRKTTQPWQNDPKVEVHGPGFSKVILDDESADHWEKHLDLIATSIAANGGRSCINASSIWTPRNGRAIAEALADRLAKVEALAADDPDAEIAAFANPAVARAINSMIDNDLRTDGAVDLTKEIRGSDRLVEKERVSYLLPTVVWCEDHNHPLANREFLFPFASVVECPESDLLNAIGSSLVVTAITRNKPLIDSLMQSPNIDRLNIGSIPTYQLSWDQPHEGNLFEHLYRQRAFQVESVA